MKYVKTHGIILRTRNGKNTDRMVTILTPDKGKIVAVARSCRDTKSKNCSMVNEHNHIVCQFYFGHSLPILTQTRLKKSFMKQRDISELSFLSYIAETVDILLEEEHFVDGVFGLVQDAYRIIEQNNYSEILPLFTIKLLTLLGYVPPLNRCGNCNLQLKNTQAVFLNDNGIIVCKKCLQQCDKQIPVECLKILYFAQQENLSSVQKIVIPKNLRQPLSEIVAKLFYSVSHRVRKSETFLSRSL